MMMVTRRVLCLAASALVVATGGSTGAAVAGARSGCDDLGGNIQSGNVCRVNRVTPTYVVDLRFRTDFVDSQPVTAYLTQERDRFVSAAQAPGPHNVSHTLTVTWEYYTSGQRLSTNRAELGYAEPPYATQSLVLKTSVTLDGIAKNATFKSFTYDLNRRRPVTFESLWAPGTNAIDAIYAAVAADLERQLAGWSFTLSSRVGRDPAIYQNFAITDDAIVFFFSEGSLLTREAGDVKATVPHAALPPLHL